MDQENSKYNLYKKIFYGMWAAFGLGILVFSESLSAAGLAGAALIVVGGVLQVGRKTDGQ